jgi:phosphatidylinositol alpha-1,6-mannosyltransferase
VTAVGGERGLRVAWVTNDLPPTSGGIQQFVDSLLQRTAGPDTLVLGPAPSRGQRELAARDDAAVPWRVERAPGRLLPTPAARRWAAKRLAAFRPDVVVIGSVWPLGLIAARLGRAAGAPVIGISHGAEAGIARGVGRRLIARAARGMAAVTYISAFTRGPVAGAVGPERLVHLPPGVDLGRFVPARTDARRLRESWGLAHDAVIVGCIARLVPRKGQDVLLRAWPAVRARHPEAHLVIVGEGPLRRRLERRARRLRGVHLVGRVAWADLPAAYAALDVFAMPVRTRFGGLDVEGFGISFLEAQATGIPVVVGRSGGAPETLPDARSGTVVDGRDPHEVAAAIASWLEDVQGRTVVREIGPAAVARWSWDRIATDFSDLLVATVTKGQSESGR